MKSRVVPVSARFIDVLGRRKNVASWHVDQNNCMRPNKHGVVHLVYYIHKQNLFWGGFSRCRGTRENTLIILLCVLLMSLAWFIYKKTGAGCWVGRTDGRTASQWWGWCSSAQTSSNLRPSFFIAASIEIISTHALSIALSYLFLRVVLLISVAAFVTIFAVCLIRETDPPWVYEKKIRYRSQQATTA